MALVVTSKIKEHIKKSKMNTASDFVPALERAIIHKVDAAIARAKSNGRKTVRAGDV
jgi:histone H3/H4